MCAFCAAIPATLAVGAKLNADQMRERREAGARASSSPGSKRVPVGKITLLMAGALVAASIVYHSQLSG